jgi:hypothetical protein
MTTESEANSSANDAWRRHSLEQLQQFQALSLREKLAAVQGMADVVRRLTQMRVTGKLVTPSDPQTTNRTAG